MNDWHIERRDGEYSAHKEIDCGNNFSLSMYVHSSKAHYDWIVYMFRHERNGNIIQMRLEEGHAATANEGQRLAKDVVLNFATTIAMNA